MSRECDQINCKQLSGCDQITERMIMIISA